MKKEKILIIKDSRLRNLIYKLRSAIIEAVSQERKRFMMEAEHEVDFQIRSELRNKAVKLMHALDRSICKCSLCHSTNSDMAYFPPYKSWYCTACFDRFHERFQSDVQRLISHPEEDF